MDLVGVIERVRKLSDRVSNEEATKQHVILPVLQALGWDIFNPDEVMPETHTEEGRPDYALMVNGRTVVFLEAKSVREKIFANGRINSKHARQLARYCFDKDVELGILTNGLQWALLKAFEPGKSIEERIILAADLMVQEPLEVANRLRWLSKGLLIGYGDIPTEYSTIPTPSPTSFGGEYNQKTNSGNVSPAHEGYPFRTLYVSAREVQLPPSAVPVEELRDKNLNGYLPVGLFVNFRGKWYEITIVRGVYWKRVNITWSSITAMVIRFLHDNGVRDFPEIGKYLSKVPQVDSRHWNVVAKVEDWYLYAPEDGRQAVEALYRIGKHTGVKIAVDLNRR